MVVEFYYDVKELFVDVDNYRLAMRFLLNLFVGLPLLLVLAIPYTLYGIVVSTFNVNEEWD